MALQLADRASSTRVAVNSTALNRAFCRNVNLMSVLKPRTSLRYVCRSQAASETTTRVKTDQPGVAALNYTPNGVRVDSTDAPMRRLSLGPNEAWYFAYGSNMNSRTLKRRRVMPLESVPCSVPGYVMTFNQAGFPYSEPCYASLERAGPPHRHQPEAHGVLHRLSQNDWQRVQDSEGVGMEPFGYTVITVTCRLYDGQEIEAQTLTTSSLSFSPYERRALPSKRYLELLKQGAATHSVAPSYQAWLASLTPYSPDSATEGLGQAAVAVTALLAFPPMATLAATYVLASNLFAPPGSATGKINNTPKEWPSDRRPRSTHTSGSISGVAVGAAGGSTLGTAVGTAVSTAVNAASSIATGTATSNPIATAASIATGIVPSTATASGTGTNVATATATGTAAGTAAGAAPSNRFSDRGSDVVGKNGRDVITKDDGNVKTSNSHIGPSSSSSISASSSTGSGTGSSTGSGTGRSTSAVSGSVVSKPPGSVLDLAFKTVVVAFWLTQQTAWAAHDNVLRHVCGDGAAKGKQV